MVVSLKKNSDINFNKKEVRKKKKVAILLFKKIII